MEVASVPTTESSPSNFGGRGKYTQSKRLPIESELLVHYLASILKARQNQRRQFRLGTYLLSNSTIGRKETSNQYQATAIGNTTVKRM